MMRISLTVAYRNEPRFHKVYSTCDLIFASSGYSDKDREQINAKYPGKVVFLSHSNESKWILRFLKTGDKSGYDEARIREVETIKASLPHGEELEVYSFHELREGLPPEKIILT